MIDNFVDAGREIEFAIVNICLMLYNLSPRTRHEKIKNNLYQVYYNYMYFYPSDQYLWMKTEGVISR